ncbi:MAG: S8 family serine peptidase [Ferruginibacter sp.]
MMNRFVPILGIFFICLSTTAFSQGTGKPIHFANADFNAAENISRRTFRKDDINRTLYNGYYYTVVQFAAIPAAAEKQQLKAAGIRLLQYIPENAFLAIIKSDFDFENSARLNIVSINAIPENYKTEPSLFNYRNNISRQEKEVFAIDLFAAENKAEAIAALKQAGVVIATSKLETANTIFVQPDVRKLPVMAALPYVSYISLQSLKDKIINYNDIALHGISSLQSLAGRNLSGKDVVVGVGDNADISTHIDFNGKIIARHPFPWDYHGTHTSGTTAGAGFLNPRNQGMAPKAHIVSQWFSDVIVNTPAYITDYNMIATNNSYYSSAVGCAGNKKYDVMSNYVDVQMRNYDEVLHVIAAGNDGSYSCSGNNPSYGTVKSGWQCAKNVITVGAMDQATYAIASFSSRGPAQDGRIKPEIVANGYATLSTYPNDTYALNYGTSMAAPVVTGVTALLQEDYRKTHSGANAKAALLKTIMCNTAEDLGNAGPDYVYGFGMLNARKAAEAMEANRYFSNTISTSQNQSYNITVPAVARRLKVLLYWADYPAAANSSVALVNDLDLKVTDPGSLLHLPLVLNPAVEYAAATEQADHINNIEQVVVDVPAAGTYVVNVNGFAVPQGPQLYYLTYQVDVNGVTVEYPFGGETLVPGTTENIRWSAYGSEANTFSIEYSDNNGTSWNLLDASSNNVPAAARAYNWVVPNTASNNYKIRITRNSTAFTDQSDYPFTVLGQPVLSTPLSVPCEGYVQLNWTAITSATSYDVFQLKGDSMALIGNTAANSFLVSGLNNITEYRFAVAAKNGSVRGRRSLSEKVTPGTGACSLAAFDGNFKAVGIDDPVTGRQFTSSALSASEQVKLRIRNLDNITSSGSYNLSYQVNGGAVITETDNVNLSPLGTYTHNFAATAAFAMPGSYTIKAWVKKAGDTQPLDDTVTVIIKNLANPILTLPVTDDFESTTVAEYTASTMGIDGDDRVDFKPGSTRGRARTFVNTGFAYSGNRAITLDQSPYGNLNTDSLLMTWNLSNYSSKQLRVDFNYKNHGQQPNPDNKVWIRGGDNQPWIYAYDLIENQNDLGQWKHGIININDIMDTVAVPQTIGAAFQVKIGQQGITSANVANPVLDQDDGYTFDDVKISEAIGDIALTQITSPLKDGCGLDNNYPVTIKVKNYTNATVNNIQVNYRFNGGAVVTETIPSIAANQSLNYTFSTRADLSAYIDYSFDCWLTAPGDNYQSNDSIIQYSLHNSPVITNYPYLEGFESGNGNWFSKGSNSTWQWGTPSKTNIFKAANGDKIWVTNLTGSYSDNELSYLYSPCFYLGGLTQPVLSFSHIFQVEQDYDYTWVEYSTDGKVWNKLGTVGSGTNWYDNSPDNNWRVSKLKWHVASIDIPPYAGTMRFRIVMASDGGVTYEGVGIDDVHVFDKAAVYTGGQLTGLNQPVSGNNWVNFYSAGKIIAAVNPLGQNLGNTTINVYPYAGAPRYSNNQYYLDRNIVISSANAPTGNVQVRLYFTDDEANNLLNASGCGTCTTAYDPYELGVTKYSGEHSEENGTLDDDLTGYFQFITPANTAIIPYDNGYYAEFTVNSFSECWLSKADIKPSSSNICPGSVINFTSASLGTNYQWQEDSGSGFADITDNANYVGTNTNSLLMVNIPTSYTGRKYRCVVDGSNGPSVTLRFVTIWTGAVSTDWQTPGNWNCIAVPDQYTDVIVPGNISYNPVLNGNTSVRSVRVYPNIQVLVKSGFKLTVTNIQ